MMSSEEAPLQHQQRRLCQGYNTLICTVYSRLASLQARLGSLTQTRTHTQTHTHKASASAHTYRASSSLLHQALAHIHTYTHTQTHTHSRTASSSLYHHALNMEHDIDIMQPYCFCTDIHLGCYKSTFTAVLRFT